MAGHLAGIRGRTNKFEILVRFRVVHESIVGEADHHARPYVTPVLTGKLARVLPGIHRAHDDPSRIAAHSYSIA
jgi:hypothetical protein